MSVRLIRPGLMLVGQRLPITTTTSGTAIRQIEIPFPAGCLIHSWGLVRFSGSGTVVNDVRVVDAVATSKALSAQLRIQQSDTRVQAITGTGPLAGNVGGRVEELAAGIGRVALELTFISGTGVNSYKSYFLIG